MLNCGSILKTWFTVQIWSCRHYRCDYRHCRPGQEFYRHYLCDYKQCWSGALDYRTFTDIVGLGTLRNMRFTDNVGPYTDIVGLNRSVCAKIVTLDFFFVFIPSFSSSLYTSLSARFGSLRG